MAGFRIGDLPRDMREELFNLHATSVDPGANERAFYRRVVPTREIDVSRLDVSGYSPASTASYDLSKTPPIVIADGKLIDGGHRVAAAQRRGITKLRAIDLTGLLNPANTGSITNLKGLSMPSPKNRSYFPLRRQLGEYKVLTRKQVSKLKRVLAKHGRKLPKPGYCTLTTKVGGKFTNIVASGSVSTSEVCSEVRNGKRVYVMRARPARTRHQWR